MSKVVRMVGEQDQKPRVIGVDLGGTKVRAATIENNSLIKSSKLPVPAKEGEKQVLAVLINAISDVLDESVQGIGVGVPSVVDPVEGIVYDVQNIPSWKKVHLKRELEGHFGLPVFLNNDANCFALGEKYFGLGHKHESFVALIIGTGMAAGIIIDHSLYNGRNCGAGEFGTIPYLDHCFEYYACGQFFTNVYQIDGGDVYRHAQQGDEEALRMYGEMGSHLGKAIQVVLYSLDPEVIILGGSVSHAYEYFEKNMWNEIRKIAFQPVSDHLEILVSQNPDLPVLGAGALCYAQF